MNFSNAIMKKKNTSTERGEIYTNATHANTNVTERGQKPRMNKQHT
jgi:hypothetical protein